MTLSLLYAACAPEYHKPSDTGSTTDTGPIDIWGRDSGDTTPTTDSVPCEPDVVEVVAQPELEERLDTPCGGAQGNLDVYPADQPDYFAFSDDGHCDEFPRPGVLHVVDAHTLDRVLAVEFNEVSGTLGGGWIELGPGDGGPVLAMSDTLDRAYGQIDLIDVVTGAALGDVDGEGEWIAANLSFAEETLLATSPHYGADAGAVYTFDAPWSAGMTTVDATAKHMHPGGCDSCMFGTILETLRDVTGDGLADAVMGGGGFWFVDGDLVHTDEGASGGVALNASAFGRKSGIENVGDIDGDGIDDYGTAHDRGDWYWGEVEILRGGQSEPFARVYSEGDSLISEGLGGLGDLDGDGYGTMVIQGARWFDTVEPDRIWLVEGGLCGTYDILDVGTRLEADPADDPWTHEAGNGFLAMPTTPLSDEEDPGWIRVVWW